MTDSLKTTLSLSSPQQNSVRIKENAEEAKVLEMQDAYMDVGARAKQDARADAYMDVGARAKQEARADGYMDNVGVRAKQYARAELFPVKSGSHAFSLTTTEYGKPGRVKP